ncbi:hypothetical protein D187_007873 [Cystobacter fuscus DSM 2262]|uniref:Uncharacterized protein n=1 Tax=Cystobacter fuscus (strain ATCC 25194 / DSM 2262 / NBRC 100088 / M29) TaxID=1242864 RepID=S9P094_CYSF2|nr:hypothetical protein D187_007873 [Cystobacter fuscus DSM 2262]
MKKIGGDAVCDLRQWPPVPSSAEVVRALVGRAGASAHAQHDGT